MGVLALARRLKVRRVSVKGRYGTISGSPDDTMIFAHYARYGVWKSLQEISEETGFL